MHEILLIEKLSDRGLSRLMFTLFTFFSSRFSRMWTLLGPKWRSKWFSAWVFVLRREFCCCFSEDGEEMYKVLKRTCWAIDLIFSFVFRPPRWSLLHQIESFPDIIAVIYRQPNALCLCIAKTKKLHILEPRNHSSRQSCTSILIGDDLCRGATETWMQSGRPLHTTREARYRTLQHQSPSQHNRARSRGKACEGEAWGH